MTTIHRVLIEHFGFAGSYFSVRHCLRGMRNARLATSFALESDPNEAVQADFGAGPTITDVFAGAVIKT